MFKSNYLQKNMIRSRYPCNFNLSANTFKCILSLFAYLKFNYSPQYTNNYFMKFITPDKWVFLAWQMSNRVLTWRKGRGKYNERGKDKLDQQFQDCVIGIIVIRQRLKFNQYGYTFSLPLSRGYKNYQNKTTLDNLICLRRSLWH